MSSFNISIPYMRDDLMVAYSSNKIVFGLNPNRRAGPVHINTSDSWTSISRNFDYHAADGYLFLGFGENSRP